MLIVKRHAKHIITTIKDEVIFLKRSRQEIISLYLYVVFLTFFPDIILLIVCVAGILNLASYTLNSESSSSYVSLSSKATYSPFSSTSPFYLLSPIEKVRSDSSADSSFESDSLTF